jgi:hypothetical protein
METKYTPGPLIAKPVEGKSRATVFCPDRGCYVCAIYGGNTGDPKDAEEANANALLHAASPELLYAALLNWEHTDDNGVKFYCNCPAFKRLSDDCRQDVVHTTACLEMQAAIAKAKGG